MIQFVEIVIALYALTVIILLVFGVIKLIRVTKPETDFNIKEITVIVPFRNEVERIKPLLESLKKQKQFPKKYLFINDHSTDTGAQLINNVLKDSEVVYEILKPNKSSVGKKSAIRYAMDFVDTTYFLIEDADVELPFNYFKELRALPQADLLVLPVSMTSKSLSQAFYSLDHFMINAVNWFISILVPLTASGANLLVKKQTFMDLTYSDFKEEIASGDDHFILRDFRIAGKKIRILGSSKFLVKTPAPKTFKELLDQRLRWAGKTTKIGDLFDLFIGAIALSFTFLLFGFTLYYLFLGKPMIALYIILSKIVLDILVYGVYFIYQKRPQYILLIPFINLIYPFYSLLLLILVPLYKPKWKGREIYLENSLDIKKDVQ